ncbi:TRI13 protein, partial [Amia calva]|nr:TRI13 protein [Amia calva]
MELLEEDLTCPICCCLFEDPRVLPCSHSFCKKCLEGILEGSRSPAWRPPFKCPTCRKETSHNGINSLQSNYALRGIVEKYNAIKHTPRMALCRTHSGQPLNIFCSTDLKLICGFCATTGQHKGHTFCALEDAYEQEKAAFDELSQSMESWRSADVLSCLESLEASKKKALQLVSRDSQRVTEYFDKLIHTLEQKKNEILSDFETLKLVVMQTFDPEINKLRTVLEEQRRALGIAETFRDAPDPLSFLLQMQEFREKLGIIRETSLPPRTDMHVGLYTAEFDIKRWDSVQLKDVDKLAAPHENSTFSLKKKRYPRVVVWLAGFICAALLALLCLDPENLACVSGHMSTVVHGCGELVDCASVCWREVARVCVLLLDLCHRNILIVMDGTADFVASYKFL